MAEVRQAVKYTFLKVDGPVLGWPVTEREAAVRPRGKDQPAPHLFLFLQESKEFFPIRKGCDIQRGDGSDGGGLTHEPGNLGSETLVRPHSGGQIFPRNFLPKRLSGLAPLDLALGAAAAEIARQFVRHGLKLLLK